MKNYSENGLTSLHVQFSLLASGILFFAAFTIAGIFLLVHMKRVDDMSARALLTQEILFSGQSASTPTNLKVLEQKASALIQLSDFHSISLLDSNSKKIFEFGLPLNTVTLGNICNTPQTSSLKNMLVASLHVDGPNNQKLCLLTRMDTTLTSLINLEFILFLSISLLFSGLLCWFYYRKLNRDIFQPLDIINDTISKQNKSKEMTPMTLANPGVFDELIQQTNERILLRIEHEVDFREHADHANKELRETLEAIEIKNIEIDLSRKNAQELNKLKSDFLTKTSQDLRTPITGILRFADFLRQTRLNKQQSDFVGSVQETARSMLTVINDINDFSKIESGGIRTENKPFDLRLCIEEALALQVTQANSHQVNLHSIFDSAIPTLISGDPLRVQQVLSNLLSNSIRFENTHNVEISAHVLARTSDKFEICILISSDGECPEELQSWRSNSSDYSMITKEFYSSVGVNLSIAKGLLSQLDGKLNFTQGNLQQFEFVISFGAEEHTEAFRPISHNFDINAVVFNHTEFGYNEVSNRLKTLGARHLRAKEFSEIPHLAKKLQADAIKNNRQLNIAIIEAAVVQQSLQKIVLSQMIKTLRQDINIPVLVISSQDKQDAIENLLQNMDCDILTHPLNSKRFYDSISNELGITRDGSRKEKHRKTLRKDKLQVLIVEDSEPNLKLAQAVLKEVNVEVIPARTGQEAVNKFTQGKQFDLVFMDIELPDISGIEATQKIREIEKDKRTPIIALSAHDVEENKTELLLNNLDDVIAKPMSASKIGYVIDRWIVNPEAAYKKIQKAKIESQDNPDATEAPTKSPIHIGTSLALANNNAGLAEEMLTTFIESLKDERDEISDSLKKNDLDELYNAIHRIHGACCYCGVPKLKSISKYLDTKLRNGEIMGINSNIDDLLNAIDEILAWEEDHEISALFA